MKQLELYAETPQPLCASKLDINKEPRSCCRAKCSCVTQTQCCHCGKTDQAESKRAVVEIQL